MKELSTKAKLYIFSVIIAGYLVLVDSIRHIGLSEPWMLLFLTCLASLSLILKVEGATDRLHYNISFLIYSFTFILLGPVDAIIVILISNLVEWVWHKYTWYIQCFNIANYLLAMYISGMIYRLISPEMMLRSLSGILGALIAMLAFTLLNHLMIGTVVWLARGENYLKSGIFDFLPLMIDFTLLCMGIGTALIWTVNPYATIYFILPLYLIYSTLKVPALERQSELDSKTGLYNAKYFNKALTKELDRANRFDRPLTVVMADLDLLRNINNTYGHLAGDQVLIGVAKILKDSSREYDVVARFGGEEFVIMLPETKPEEIIDHMENIRGLIQKAEFTVPTSVIPIQVTMSFGIAGRQGFNQNPGDVIHNADTALYYAKLRGRNRVHIFSDDVFKSFIEDENKVAPGKISIQDRLQAAEFEYIPNPLREPPKTRSTIDDPNDVAERAYAAHITKPEHTTNLFIAVLTFLSLSWFLILPHQVSSLDWTGLLVFTAVVIITEGLSVDIYARESSVSTSAVPMLGGILLFGPTGALVLSSTFALVAKLKHHSPISRFFFNASNQLIAGLSYTTLLFLLRISFHESPHLIQILIALAASAIDYLLTTFLVALAMHFNHGAKVRQVWKEQFRWLGIYYASMGLIAYALVFSYQTASIFGLLLLLIPLLLIRFSQKQFIDRTRGVVQELREKNLMLESKTQEIMTLNDSLFSTLSEVIDMRDPYVLGHSKRVTRYAVLIAQRLGLPEARVEMIRKASLLHDIGKLGIPDEILQKPSSLTPKEYEIIKSHTIMGSSVLETSHGLKNLIPIVRHHHEWFNGSGYPDGLKGKNIPLEARIVSLADAIEAMASDRPYRKGLKMEDILFEIQKGSGIQFDPDIVNVFLDIIETQGDKTIDNSNQKVLEEREKIPA